MDYGAFIDKDFSLKPHNNGKLDGLTFAVKDVFNIKDYRNTAGNPIWFDTHLASNKTARALTMLLEKGASLSGITITDEIMFSLNGENIHYGTPVNPIDDQRIPGGSSSGSAVAVAAGLVDFSMGTDTGGSVRLPSSYCGLYGMRPSHNDVPIDQVIPLAPSFDTVGWMARDLETLVKVGDVLLPKATTPKIDKILLDQQCWSFVEEPYLKILMNAVDKIPFEKVFLNVCDEDLSKWSEVFKTIQGKEAWNIHGKWIEKYKPQFAPAIASRFENASQVTVEEYENAQKKQDEIIVKMCKILNNDKILIVPTTATVAPLKGENASTVEKTRAQALKINSIAGLAGLPQITVPIRTNDGLSIGLSFIAGKHFDRSLLQFVAQYLPDSNELYKRTSSIKIN